PIFAVIVGGRYRSCLPLSLGVCKPKTRSPSNSSKSASGSTCRSFGGISPTRSKTVVRGRPPRRRSDREDSVHEIAQIRELVAHRIGKLPVAATRIGGLAVGSEDPVEFVFEVLPHIGVLPRNVVVFVRQREQVGAVVASFEFEFGSSERTQCRGVIRRPVELRIQFLESLQVLQRAFRPALGQGPLADFLAEVEAL